MRLFPRFSWPITDNRRKINSPLRTTIRPCVTEFESRITPSAVTDAAYSFVHRQAIPNQADFYVYQDADSAYNHSFPSGKFGSISKIQVDTAAIDSPSSITGVTTDTNALDRLHGNVLSVAFSPMTTGEFAGINFEEPQNWGTAHSGNGYNLSGATEILLDVRSPTPGGMSVQFGVGGSVTSYIAIPQSSTYTTLRFPLATLQPALTNLTDVHILFSVATNVLNSPNGGTLLIDNIRFNPVPTSQKTALGFPVANQSFGVVPLANPSGDIIAYPLDQVQRNISTIYESSLAVITLLQRGAPNDIAAAKQIADTFVYALSHDNHGNPLPTTPTPGGGAGLHNAYFGGDIALFNSQQPPGAGLQGDVRLAGFSPSGVSSGFNLVSDGATGGNNAFAILALTNAYDFLRDPAYLSAAATIGNWIYGNLVDTAVSSFGGYFLGYPDQGIVPKTLNQGKSIENNADIFAAFTALAAAEAERGNTSAAMAWSTKANVAGDFVMQMYDPTNQRFNAGTVLSSVAAGDGITSGGAVRGAERVNTFDFLDANTFPILAMAGSTRYRAAIDWRGPTQYILDHFAKTVTAGGRQFSGFNLVQAPSAGPDGIAWEFTGQAVLVFKYVDFLYGETRFAGFAQFYLDQIGRAQTAAPFADGSGIVASTIQGGDAVPPLRQALVTPFANTPAERVALAASAFAIEASLRMNPFLPASEVNYGFIQALYQRHLGRSGSVAELDAWSVQVGAFGRANVANGIARSPESLRRVVDNIYLRYLGRSAFGDPSSASWITAIQSGRTLEQTIAGVVGSPEFASRASVLSGKVDTNENYIRALYTLMLDRVPSDNEVAAWLKYLSTASRAQSALLFAGSIEFRTACVRTLYGDSTAPAKPYLPNLLHRRTLPAPQELAAWASFPRDLLFIAQSIAASDEFFES